MEKSVIVLSGEYSVTLDAKGRLSIPAKFREGIPDNMLILTKGISHCIWAFTVPQWEKFSAVKFATAGSLSIEEADMIQHRFLIPSEAELDKAGRIPVPQKLRDFAGLTKNCVVASAGKRIELWDEERYVAYEKLIDEQIGGLVKKLGPFDLFNL